MTNTLLFDISFLGWILLEAWVVWREQGGLQGNRKDQGSKIVISISVLSGLILGFVFKKYASHYTITYFHQIIFMVGIFLIWFGVIFRFWSIQTLGKYFRTIVLIQRDHDLITTGPYSYLRHPAYTGSLLTLLGIGLCLGNWLSSLVVLATIIAGYFWRVRVEEKLLREHFGRKYDEYKKHTWAIIPFIW